MLRIVNHNKKIIIACPFMCGTTFLHSYVLKNEDYEHVRGNWHIPNGYKVLRVVREPIQRFYSWYNKFVHLNDEWLNSGKNRFHIERINKKNIESWFEKFSLLMHYDGHIGLQKYIHIVDYRFNIDKIEYIHSYHLQNFLGIKSENYQTKNYSLPLKKECDKYLYEFYKQDIEWIDNLRIIR